MRLREGGSREGRKRREKSQENKFRNFGDTLIGIFRNIGVLRIFLCACEWRHKAQKHHLRKLSKYSAQLDIRLNKPFPCLQIRSFPFELGAWVAP